MAVVPPEKNGKASTRPDSSKTEKLNDIKSLIDLKILKKC